MSIVLPRLDSTIEIVELLRTPTLVFHQWWQKVARAIEDAFTAVTAAQLSADTAQDNAISALTNAAAAQATANSAQTAAAAAQTTADAAQTTATDAVQKDATASWAAVGGTLDRTTYTAYAGQTISATPTQAQVQAIDDHLKIVSRHLAALITDLRAIHALHN